VSLSISHCTHVKKSSFIHVSVYTSEIFFWLVFGKFLHIYFCIFYTVNIWVDSKRLEDPTDRKLEEDQLFWLESKQIFGRNPSKKFFLVDILTI
jgi:hypothetical protein